MSALYLNWYWTNSGNISYPFQPSQLLTFISYLYIFSHPHRLIHLYITCNPFIDYTTNNYTQNWFVMLYRDEWRENPFITSGIIQYIISIHFEEIKVKGQWISLYPLNLRSFRTILYICILRKGYSVYQLPQRKIHFSSLCSNTFKALWKLD